VEVFAFFSPAVGESAVVVLVIRMTTMTKICERFHILNGKWFGALKGNKSRFVALCGKSPSRHITELTVMAGMGPAGR